MQPRLLLTAVCLAFALAVGGCNNVPTLPLPPPVASIGEPSVQGLVTVEGQVNPRAFVNVFNERTEAGVITRADQDGHFVAELEAGVGDLITIWQEINGESGEHKELTVPEPD
jgi:hypothetical protein